MIATKNTGSPTLESHNETTHGICWATHEHLILFFSFVYSRPLVLQHPMCKIRSIPILARVINIFIYVTFRRKLDYPESFFE